MATFEVTVENITVYPHPDADRLEYAQVGLYNVVIPKDVYKTGDSVFYIPEFAVLPDALITTLGLEGKLAGKQKNRVKPIKLRNLLSQGLVAPLTIAEGINPVKGVNYAELLGIHKWEPPIPASLAGDVKSAPELIRWIDIENIKKYPDMFAEGELVVVDEKIHGTATCVTVIDIHAEREVFVTSKGIGARNLSLKEDPKNAYWRMFHKYNLMKIVEHIAVSSPDVDKVAVFGETYGSVQDLHYGLNNDLGFILFDIKVHTSEGERWLSPEETAEIAKVTEVPLAPRLYEGPYSLGKITELAYGPEQLSGTEANIREGVVVRPAASNPDKTYNGFRKIGKFVSDDYLTRKNGTEFN